VVAVENGLIPDMNYKNNFGVIRHETGEGSVVLT
jgi:hypothetical protein